MANRMETGVKSRQDGRSTRPRRPEFDVHGERLRQKPGPKPGTPQARNGGIAAARMLGRDHYVRIGKMGGATVKQRHGSEFYARIGKRGGQATKARHGHDYYATIGSVGGKAKRAPAHKRHEGQVADE